LADPRQGDAKGDALLEMRGIVRRFGDLCANDNIDLDVRRGEILGLLGENGSGKSTLMKVLFGMLAPDSGAIALRGQPLVNHTPAEAMAAGIAMIHQHFMLIEAMTVAENVMLGWPAAGRILRKGEISARVREASQRFGLDLDPDAQVAKLPLGRRQRVEILKAILRDADLLILDEPTSNLAPAEVGDLLTILRRLRDENKGIVFISHKLPEVLDVCDNVVVLRAGRVAGRAPVAGASRGQLAEMMIGRDVSKPRDGGSTKPPGAARLAVRDFSAPGLGSLSFEIRSGEILGVAGVDGNGQLELVEALTGLLPSRSGVVTLDGHDITRSTVASRMRLGLAYMPADRGHTALVKGMSVFENLMLRDCRRSPYGRGPLLTRAPGAAKARALMADYDIRARDPDFKVARLSGGNQQKIVVARELDRRPGVLIAHQAAWGLDPGATRFVLDRMVALRDEGAAVIYISSELEEVLTISDRIAVMAGGGFAGIVPRAEADMRQIGLWMAGRAA
jgi:general nucleoside transport system ATP-binding protein